MNSGPTLEVLTCNLEGMSNRNQSAAFLSLLLCIEGHVQHPVREKVPWDLMWFELIWPACCHVVNNQRFTLDSPQRAIMILLTTRVTRFQCKSFPSAGVVGCEGTAQGPRAAGRGPHVGSRSFCSKNWAWLDLASGRSLESLEVPWLEVARWTPCASWWRNAELLRLRFDFGNVLSHGLATAEQCWASFVVGSTWMGRHKANKANRIGSKIDRRTDLYTYW